MFRLLCSERHIRHKIPYICKQSKQHYMSETAVARIKVPEFLELDLFEEGYSYELLNGRGVPIGLLCH